MAYTMTQIAENVYVGKRADGNLDIEVWISPKPDHATASDYDANCQELLLPSHAVEALFDYLR